MCLAIACPAGKKVPDSYLKNGWDGNNDGAGFAYRKDDGSVIVSKGHMKFDSFKTAYDEAFESNSTSPFIIHFRTKTHGQVTPENTHPFAGKYGAMVHNGVISGLGDQDNSDTAEFAKLMVEVPEERLVHVMDKLRTSLGWSKFAFIGRDTGTIYVFPKGQGLYDDGIWYSNSCYRSSFTDYGGRSYSGRHYPLGFMGD